MKLCIFGAGAIGGWLGARLARQGEDVTPDRARAAPGRHAGEGADVTDGRRASPSPARHRQSREAGPQDYVIVTLKAHSVPARRRQDAPLLGPRHGRGDGA